MVGSPADTGSNDPDVLHRRRRITFRAIATLSWAALLALALQILAMQIVPSLSRRPWRWGWIIVALTVAAVYWRTQSRHGEDPSDDRVRSRLIGYLAPLVSLILAGTLFFVLPTPSEVRCTAPPEAGKMGTQVPDQLSIPGAVYLSSERSGDAIRIVGYRDGPLSETISLFGDALARPVSQGDQEAVKVAYRGDEASGKVSLEEPHAGDFVRWTILCETRMQFLLVAKGRLRSL